MRIDCCTQPDIKMLAWGFCLPFLHEKCHLKEYFIVGVLAYTHNALVLVTTVLTSTGHNCLPLSFHTPLPVTWTPCQRKLYTL